MFKKEAKVNPQLLTVNLSLASTKLNKDGDIFTLLQPELSQLASGLVGY